jgi:hypothetical protein
MSNVWRDWERRKRGLDISHKRAIGVLNSLLFSSGECPLESSHLEPLKDLPVPPPLSDEEFDDFEVQTNYPPMYTPNGLQYMAAQVQDQHMIMDMAMNPYAGSGGGNHSIAARGTPMATDQSGIPTPRSAVDQTSVRSSGVPSTRVCPHCGLLKEDPASGMPSAL